MNRTKKYLASQINLLDDQQTRNALYLITTIGYYIADADFYFAKSLPILENYLFILTDPYGQFNETKNEYYDLPVVAKKKFLKNLDTVKKCPLYVADYQFDQTNHKHVIVLRLPVDDSVYKLLKGKYSELYSKEQIHEMFPIYKGESDFIKQRNEHNLEVRGILNKDSYYEDLLKALLQEKYGVDINKEDLSGRELDLPASIPGELRQEVLNFNEEFVEFVGLKKFLERA